MSFFFFYTSHKCPKPYWNIGSLPDYIHSLESRLWLLGDHVTDSIFLHDTIIHTYIHLFHDPTGLFSEILIEKKNIHR